MFPHSDGGKALANEKCMGSCKEEGSRATASGWWPVWGWGIPRGGSSVEAEEKVAEWLRSSGVSGP